MIVRTFGLHSPEDDELQFLSRRFVQQESKFWPVTSLRQALTGCLALSLQLNGLAVMDPLPPICVMQCFFIHAQFSARSGANANLCVGLLSTPMFRSCAAMFPSLWSLVLLSPSNQWHSLPLRLAYRIAFLSH